MAAPLYWNLQRDSVCMRERMHSTWLILHVLLLVALTQMLMIERRIFIRAHGKDVLASTKARNGLPITFRSTRCIRLLVLTLVRRKSCWVDLHVDPPAGCDFECWAARDMVMHHKQPRHRGQPLKPEAGPIRPDLGAGPPPLPYLAFLRPVRPAERYPMLAPEVRHGYCCICMICLSLPTS